MRVDRGRELEVGHRMGETSPIRRGHRTGERVQGCPVKGIEDTDARGQGRTSNKQGVRTWVSDTE